MDNTFLIDDGLRCPNCGHREIFESLDHTFWCPECDFHTGASVKQLICPSCGSEELCFENGIFRCFQCDCTVRVECASVEGPDGGSGRFQVTSLKTVEILPGIRSLNCAFTEFTELEQMILPEGLIEIGHDAFAGCCSLKELNIPKSVQHILTNVFSGCAVESIELPEGICEIPDLAFNDCSQLEHVVIPQSVTKIGDAAFQRCTSLKTITLPEGVTKLGCCAFNGCTALTTIHHLHSEIDIGSFAFRGVPAIKQET